MGLESEPLIQPSEEKANKEKKETERPVIHGLKPEKKEEMILSEKKDKVEADLFLLESTHTAREEIYKDLKIGKSSIDSIEDALKSLATSGKLNFNLLSSDMPENEIQAMQLAFDRISVKVLGGGKWPLPSLQEFHKKGNLEDIKKIEVIVHPLYGLLKGEQWDPEQWEESMGDVEKYIEKKIIKIVQKIIEKLKEYPSYIPSAYLYIMEISQELKAMQQPPKEGVVRVFNMPRRSLLNKNMRGAMDQLLKKYSGENVAVIDSYHDGTGRLNDSDIYFFQDNLPQNTLVEIQGGYLGGCLDGAYLSFEKGARKGRQDIKLQIDFDPSTGFMGPSFSNLNEGETKNIFRNAPQITLPPFEIETIQDVIKWVESNSGFNTFWKNFAEPHHREQLEGYLVSAKAT